jgi:hypothetical protein
VLLTFPSSLSRQGDDTDILTHNDEKRPKHSIKNGHLKTQVSIDINLAKGISFLSLEVGASTTYGCGGCHINSFAIHI